MRKVEPVPPIVSDYVKLVAKAKDRSLSFEARRRAKVRTVAAFEVMTGLRVG